jgi:hypothetical protein
VLIYPHTSPYIFEIDNIFFINLSYFIIHCDLGFITKSQFGYPTGYGQCLKKIPQTYATYFLSYCLDNEFTQSITVTLALKSTDDIKTINPMHAGRMSAK